MRECVGLSQKSFKRWRQRSWSMMYSEVDIEWLNSAFNGQVEVPATWKLAHFTIRTPPFCPPAVKNEDIEGFWEVFKQFDLK